MPSDCGDQCGVEYRTVRVVEMPVTDSEYVAIKGALAELRTEDKRSQDKQSRARRIKSVEAELSSAVGKLKALRAEYKDLKSTSR